MPQTTHRDREEERAPDGHRDHLQSTTDQPLQRESNFGDSSGPLFSIYSKAAEDEDNKMAERWQKDADGILIFTGLFSAAVAALLAVTVQDLRPNSQDTSAFHLGNIYQVLADPNVSRSSIPSPVAKPPPFSPPRYAVWVNSLWFLSLVMSVSCALWATSLHQWARRYIRLTQPARCSPEKRARMRAFFADGVDKMHVPWAVEGLPTLLHLSLFLFFGGLVIFLFNVDQEVFTCVVWWIGLFSMVYGLITVLPLLRQDSPYNTPLSIVAWFLHASIQYLNFKVLAFITSGRYGSYQTWKRCCDSRDRYHCRMLRGVEKIVKETASELSTEIDVCILGWTISALGDDDSLERFFEAIPGFFDSRLVKHLEIYYPATLLKTFWSTLDGFMGRTLSSNSVTESVKSRRIVICRDIMSMIPCPNDFLYDNLRDHFDQAPVSIEKLQAMARWFAHMSRNVFYTARIRVAKNLPRMQERDGRWIALANEVYGLSERDLQHNVALGGDNALLATLIHVSHRASQELFSDELGLVVALTRFDIRHTLPQLQKNFCALWNELVQKSRKGWYYGSPANILIEIRHLYIALHQGTDAAPTAFPPSINGFNPRLFPLCDIAGHYVSVLNSPGVPALIRSCDSPGASTCHSTSSSGTISRQVEEASVVALPPLLFVPTSPGKIGDTTRALAAISPALPVHTGPRPADASPPDTVAAAQDILPVAVLSHPPEGTAQRDLVTPFAKPDISETLFTASTPTLTPTLAPVAPSTPPVRNRSSISYNASAVSTNNSLPFAPPALGFSNPASSPLPRVPPLTNAESFALLNSATPSHSTTGITLPRLRACGLVNTGGMCFANAVSQLLVHSPLFWNLFRKLGDLRGQRGAGGPETGGGATPMVDATVRFVEEFMLKGKETLQQVAGGKPRGDEEAMRELNVVDSFELMYMYDAMKRTRQLKTLLDGQQQDAEEFFRLYLDILDDELLSLLAPCSHESATVTPGVDEREVSQSGMNDVGKQVFTVESVESPLMRIFSGKFRSTLRAPNQPDTVTIDYWRSLQLDIQHDSVHGIEDALARISHLQPVQLGPSGLGEASQQVKIEALPPVLVLHLKRFLYDATADGMVKVSKPVQFAPELEIPREIMAPVASGRSAEPACYKLYGVLYHHGESAGSGHYTVDVLHQNGDSGSEEAWLRIDDETVSAVGYEDVFGGHDNERVNGRCAYMLFYYRTAPSRT